MKFKKQLILSLLILCAGTSINVLLSQNIQSKPTRQSSFEAFSSENYEKAYNEFSELLITYTKDPLYKYYSGVCLVKLKRDPVEAVTLLQDALKSATVVRRLPSDAMLYLGRAQQMSGQFQEAISSYNLYSDQVGRKAAKAANIPGFIHECIEKEGKIAETESKIAVVKKDTIEISQKENQKLSPEYEKILDEALDFQYKADSLNNLSSKNKQELETIPDTLAPGLKNDISKNEMLAASFQKTADQKFNDAQVSMDPNPERVLQIPEVDSAKLLKPIVSKDSVNISGEILNMSSDEKVEPVAETFAFFEVVPKTVSDTISEIVIEPVVPEGLIYRIQVAVFRNPVAPDYFKGVYPVYGFKIAGTDKKIYYAGMFRRYSDASSALKTVKAKGFNDAFIVAFAANKKISTDRAGMMEKEWGKKPFINLNKLVLETPVDTIPPTLSFRIEVTRSLKPLKDDVIKGIKRVAGGRIFNIELLEDKNIVYLIGNFITFVSALEYADLLIRNGYSEAKVVAWLGKREIPVEIARQLFENIE
jgi:hypothetical protein